MLLQKKIPTMGHLHQHHNTLLFYSLCCLCLCVPSFGTFPVFPVSRPIPDFYAKIPDFYANIPCYLGLYARYCTCCTGGPCVARRRLQPRTWCYPGVQFNLLSRSPILGPSVAPVPAGDWGAELCGSSMSRTSQRRSRCVRLTTPVLAKGVLPFSLT